MALYQMSLQIGATIGPGLGGYVAHIFGYAAPFWLYMIVGLAASATAFFAFEDTLNAAEARKPLPSSVSRTGMMTEAFTVVCILTLVIFFTRVVTLFQLIPLMGAETFGLDVGSIGLALTVCAATNLIGLPMTAPLINRFGSRIVVIGSTIASAFSVAMLWLDSNVLWFWLSVAVMGVAMGVSYPSLSTYVMSCLPRERYGPGMGMQRSFGDIGFVFGPVIAGALDDYAGPGHASIIIMNVALLLAGTLLFAVGSRKERGVAR
jgi:DHA1 family multidrug resistance protein-like MFS transporter